ncbi:unnamed protein product [Adineta ricciae]|uniref:Uncharacterized protein n=1 Tax=Adineta ricciae TaxID=249248 RepID=A0A816G548_ADIRI|nr:unnamed protein product [Adineta ricciae]
MVTASQLPALLLGMIPNFGGRFVVYIFGLLTSLFLSFILFETIYFIIPNKKMTIKETWCGALAAAIGLQLFMIVFPIYVKNFMASYTGQIGFVVILLIFLFYSAVIFILGAQINAFFFEHIQPLPVSLGTFVSAIADEYRERETREPLNI